MKVGLIARGEDRGLGIQTWEFYRHVKPDRTLLIDVGRHRAGGFPMHPDRYPDATVAAQVTGPRREDDKDEFEDEDLVRDWLAGLDVVYSAETYYDWRILDWAREAKVATVLHCNPEFYFHWADDAPPHPTAWWAPTTWRLNYLPRDVRVVPMPVAMDRIDQIAPAPDEGVIRFLHPVGHRAAADRAGTTLLLPALRLVRSTIHVTMATQDRRLPALKGLGRNVTLATQLAGVDNYWDLYHGYDALILPRRYGGLSLPTIEALGAGMAVIMPDCSPNPDMWPIVPVRSRPEGHVATKAGKVRMHTVDPVDLANAIDLVAGDHDVRNTAKAQARQWAEANRWEARLPSILDELTRAAEMA